jgi:hypothetical protein
MDTISTRSTQSPPEPTSLTSPPAAETEAATDSSPKRPMTKPGLVLRVGVSGHRDLPVTEMDRLQEQVRGVLQRIARIAEDISESRNNSGLEVYSDQPLVLRMISPLAEGADRLVAEQAIAEDLGFILQCPLPFPKEEYEEDFKKKDDHPIDTREDFRKFLKEAEGAILELDGKRSAENEAYEAVGRLVLRQCDVLIAVWDPKREEKTGGTRQIVRESLGLATPTVWISAAERREPCLLLSIDPLSTERLEALDKRLRKLFLFGIETEGDANTQGEREEEKREREEARRAREVVAAKCFFEESLPQRDSGRVFRWFRTIWCWQPFKKKTKPPAIKPVWSPLFAANPEFRDQIEKNYEWADCLANYYGGLYRSSFIATYCMGALAVLVAFLGFYVEDPPWYEFWHWIYFTIELLLITSIFLITGAGRRNRWHQRWMDYRLLAESLRQVQFLAPLGRVTLSFKVPAHIQPSDPRNSWFNWYFRALVRDGGLICTKFDPSYLQTCKQALTDAIQGQIQYHRDNHERLEILSKRLHRAAQASFGIAAFGCILHINHWSNEWISLTVNLATIVLPAFGAALGAISHHGEFERLSLRSEALAERLTNLQEDLNRQSSSTSKELGRAAETFSEVVFGELLDWRFAFLEKNLELPA